MRTLAVATWLAMLLTANLAIILSPWWLLGTAACATVLWTIS